MTRTTRTLADGIYFGEGPRWHDGRLWFSDFYAHAVKSVSLAGDLRTEFTIDDQPSGLGWMPDGSMLIVSMTRQQLLRRTDFAVQRGHVQVFGLPVSLRVIGHLVTGRGHRLDRAPGRRVDGRAVPGHAVEAGHRRGVRRRHPRHHEHDRRHHDQPHDHGRRADR